MMVPEEFRSSSSSHSGQLSLGVLQEKWFRAWWRWGASGCSALQMVTVVDVTISAFPSLPAVRGPWDALEFYEVILKAEHVLRPAVRPQAPCQKVGDEMRKDYVFCIPTWYRNSTCFELSKITSGQERISCYGWLAYWIASPCHRHGLNNHVSCRPVATRFGGTNRSNHAGKIQTPAHSSRSIRSDCTGLLICRIHSNPEIHKRAWPLGWPVWHFLLTPSNTRWFAKSWLTRFESK